MAGFNPGEARDERGQWSSGGGARGAKLAERAKDVAQRGTVAGSTAGGYSPGGWSRSDSVPDRQAKVDRLAERLAQARAAEVAKKKAADPRLTEVVATPEAYAELARATAEELVPHDVATYTNGPHRVQMVEAMPEASRAQFLDTVDHMIQTYPGPTVNLSVQDKDFAWAVGGDTQLGTGNIRLNAQIFGYPGSDWAGEAHWGGGMPASGNVSISQYVLAHEWGHAVNDEPFGAAPNYESAQARVAGMSDYGKSSPYEAYAEAFAEWSLTGGKTTNVAAQQYARDYGWAKRWPNATGAH
jgi:hypothetical protein